MQVASTQARATIRQAQEMKTRTGTRASGQARTSTACYSPPKAFAAWHIAPQARRAMLAHFIYKYFPTHLLEKGLRYN
jgi:hypothetical protein